MESLPPEHIEYAVLSLDVIALRDAYLAAGLVRTKWHVAAASVTGVDAIVSWNFKHIVRLDRINAYNAVNERRGFRRLTIITPMEVTRAIHEEGSQAVAFKRKVQEGTYAAIKWLSPDEEIAYFDRQARMGPFASLWRRLERCRRQSPIRGKLM